MKLDELGLDRIKTFGQPYHGLWKAGSIALPNSTSKTCPAPASGGVVLLRVPGQPAVSRTAPELAADAAAGREWRNYGLISGGRYGAVALPQFSGEGVVFLIDAAKKCWLMRVYTDPGMVNYMTVRLRRFGLINGTTDSGWSAPINVSISSDFVTLPYTSFFPNRTLHVVCQNTTGREFVIGYVAASTEGFSWTEALCKISVSGSVDLAAAGFGLTFSSLVLEGQQRHNSSFLTDAYSTGVCRHEQTWQYLEYTTGSSATPTGNTADREIVWQDGSIISDDGAPTGGTGNWGGMTLISESRTSSKEYVFSTVEDYDFFVWAAYEDDDLRLVKMRVTRSDGGSVPANIFSGGLWTTGPQVNYTTARVVATYGSTVIFDESSVVGSNNYSVEYPASIGDSPVNHDAHASSSGRAAFSALLDAQGSQSLSYPRRLVTAKPSPWNSPVVFYCSQTVTVSGPGTVYSDYTGISAHAPSGAFQTTSIPISTLFASWQPVTDQLAVDSVPICWF